MAYLLIYDGTCNLCTALVQALETWDQGRLFYYSPMQDEFTLAQYGLTPADGEQGVILIDLHPPHDRWQGEAAVVAMAHHVPWLAPLLKGYGDWAVGRSCGQALYAQVRDHRYRWFGQRPQCYVSPYRPPQPTAGQC